MAAEPFALDTAVPLLTPTVYNVLQLSYKGVQLFCRLHTLRRKTGISPFDQAKAGSTTADRRDYVHTILQFFQIITKRPQVDDILRLPCCASS